VKRSHGDASEFEDLNKNNLGTKDNDLGNGLAAAFQTQHTGAQHKCMFIDSGEGIVAK